MQATIQLYFSTLSLPDLEHYLALLIARGATHYGRPSRITTPVSEVQDIVASVSYATSFSLRGRSALGIWTADFTTTPQRALRIEFDSPIDQAEGWAEASAMLDEFLLPSLVDYCVLQGFSHQTEQETSDDYRLRVSGRLSPGVFARSGMVALGFDNFVGPRILRIMPAEVRDSLLAHPLANVLGDGARIAVSSTIPTDDALLERAELNARAQHLGLVRELESHQGIRKLSARGPRWWRAPAAGMLLVRFDPTLRRMISILEGSQKTSAKGQDLAGQVLPFSFFAECRITDCRFSNATMSYSAMSSAIFTDCDFTGATLVGVDAQHAAFIDASLVRADLSFADLSHTNLKDARLDHAILRGTRLCDASGIESARSANFDGACATGLALGHAALLDDASFRGADLSGADFSGASLAGADFSGAKLDNAIFRGADLSRAVFAGAETSHADLGDARLEGVTL